MRQRTVLFQSSHRVKVITGILGAMSLMACVEAPSVQEAPKREMASRASALAGNNLGGFNLAGSNLAGVNLASTNLAGVNLGGDNLAGNNLAGNNLAGVNLGGNNLAGNNLASSNLASANLAGVNLASVNLAGVNLASTNLAGSNLAGVNLAGSNLASVNLAGVNLASTNAAMNIHDYPVVDGMLFSGEDLIPDKTQQCIVAGIGSTAFAKLINENKDASGAGAMKSALKRLPWGFSSISGGSVELEAWEAVVWGQNTYCVFVLVAPPSATFSGVAGFLKAIWRWQAPPTMSLDIGQMGGGETVQTHSGMMNTAALWASGAIDATSLVAGELAFVTATVNNQTVSVDFASWTKGTSGSGVILGNVSDAPAYAEVAYVVFDKGDGTVQVGMHIIPGIAAPVIDSLENYEGALDSYLAGIGPEPRAKRCAGALKAEKHALMLAPPGKCDNGLYYTGMWSEAGAATWASAGGTAMPYNQYMDLSAGSYAGCILNPDGTGCSGPPGWNKPILSETYVHLNEPAYDYRLSYLDAPTQTFSGQTLSSSSKHYGPFAGGCPAPC
jgi:hypothetical protein